MPTTRSMRTLSSLTSRATTPPNPPKHDLKTKRKTQPDASESPSQNNKKPRITVPTSLGTQVIPRDEVNEILPAALTFSFEAAKQHLISVDARFDGVFKKLPCRPFEQLERVDPFQTLATSILGQQISWLAARSIRHRFIRLYDPSLPEKPPALGSDTAKDSKDFFPTADQVVDTDITTLRSAGLSTRKAEYIKDLASRFADGRLTNKKLVEADDEELAKLLIEVRGIGRWTVDMFAMFSLRRPDILPVGDLGVQRGVMRWFLSLHSPSDPVTISPKKLPKPMGDVSGNQDTPPDVVIQQPDKHTQEELQINDPLPLPLPSSTSASMGGFSSLPPVPVTPTKGKGKIIAPTMRDGAELGSGSLAILPEPFTPSINKILNPKTKVDLDVDGVTSKGGQSLAPLPDGLTVTVMRNRLNTKKKIKGALLTPKEMEDLTAPWRPYRSLGVYYMWALAEETTTNMT